MPASGGTLLQMTATPTTVVFACPKCAAIYRATQYQVPDMCFGTFNCLACHTQVYAWNGLYDFVDWEVGFRAGDADMPVGKKS